MATTKSTRAAAGKSRRRDLPAPLPELAGLTRDKIGDLSEELDGARATVLLCAQALGDKGGSDAEILSAAALRAVASTLEEIGYHLDAQLRASAPERMRDRAALVAQEASRLP
jgi:hypothetical protein